MPHHVRMNPLLDQGLFYHGFDEAVNRFGGKPLFFVGAVLAKGIEKGVIRVGPVPVGVRERRLLAQLRSLPRNVAPGVLERRRQVRGVVAV